MAEPPAPPKKKNQRRLVIFGAAAVGILILLYLRSRSAAAQQAGGPSQADLQSALQQQQLRDQMAYGSTQGTTFPGDSANVAQLDTDITGALGQLTTQLTQWQNAMQNPPASGPAPAPQPAPSSGPSITINNNGQPAAGSGPATTTVASVAQRDKPFLAPGAHAPPYILTPPRGAPSNARWAGGHRPGPNWVGIGGGWWRPRR